MLARVDSILIVKTGALGDVLRTTSILPGLRKAWPRAGITWVTARGAEELVERHPDVAHVVTVDPKDAADVERATDALAGEAFDWVLSFDDEEPLCRMAARLGTARLSGATLSADGRRTYTPDVAPWFDMGLLSVHGKQEADRRKLANRRSHPEIFAAMLGIEMGEPRFDLADPARAHGVEFARRHEFDGALAVGLNTGAGGRWHSKQLDPERTVQLAAELARRVTNDCVFCVLGGGPEAERNAEIARGLEACGLRVADAGTGNTLGEFGGIVSQLDLLVTSDSLALHVGIARRVPLVAFFAPTSAAEIELYGRGEKVSSTAPDYCTYRPDVDTGTLTVERLADAALRVLAARE